jgi:hypothetical protein
MEKAGYSGTWGSKGETDFVNGFNPAQQNYAIFKLLVNRKLEIASNWVPDNSFESNHFPPLTRAQVSIFKILTRPIGEASSSTSRSCKFMPLNFDRVKADLTYRHPVGCAL